MGNVVRKNRFENKGDEYIDSFPKLKKWIVECRACHLKGYRPDMPEHVLNEFSYDGFLVRKYFDPLEINENGLCDICSKIIN